MVCDKEERDVVDMELDMVNSPPHYTMGKIECIDAIEAATTGLDGIEAFCTGNAMKYIFRWKHKNGMEDIDKAIWYLNQLKISIGKGESLERLDR